MQYSFGSGLLFGTRTDSGASPTPRMFGVLQETEIEFSFNIKELFGQYQFPVAVARGQGKISGKAKFANINAAVYNDLFFNGTLTNNSSNLVATGESGTIPGTPYQITVANSANFVEDLGVWAVATGLPLTRVASAPATGQYSVAAGVYTFAAADTTLSMLIYYRYSATSGKKISITNALTGVIPTFSVVLSTQYNSKQINLKLNQATSSKLSFGTKMEDFLVPEMDMSFFADASNVIGELSVVD